MVPNNSDDLQLCKSVPKRQQIILWEATVDALIEQRRRAAFLRDFIARAIQRLQPLKIWSSCTQELTPDQMAVDKSQTVRCPRRSPQRALCCLMLCSLNLKICGLIKAPLTAWDYSYPIQTTEENKVPCSVNLGCAIFLYAGFLRTDCCFSPLWNNLCIPIFLNI